MTVSTLAALGIGALLTASLYTLGPGTATASSHREAPLVAADPAIDNTDLYAFVSPERPGYVTFVANWQPFEEPDGGPNFYPFATDATCHIKVDSDGDARPDAEFRWTFRNVDERGNRTFLCNDGPVTTLDDKNLLFKQTYTLESSFGGAYLEQARVTAGPGLYPKAEQAAERSLQLRRDGNSGALVVLGATSRTPGAGHGRRSRSTGTTRTRTGCSPTRSPSSGTPPARPARCNGCSTCGRGSPRTPAPLMTLNFADVSPRRTR